MVQILIMFFFFRYTALELKIYIQPTLKYSRNLFITDDTQLIKLI